MAEIKKDGPTRTFHVYDSEVLDLVTYLVARTQAGSRSTKDYDDRKRTRAMLKQLGAYDMYMKLTDKRGSGFPVSSISDVPRFVEMTLESMDYFLSQIKDVPIAEAMRVCELEERVSSAKSGSYSIPPEVAAQTETETEAESSN